jgi:hypothetical protein
MNGIFSAVLILAAASPSQGAADETCRMFEIEVASVDKAGQYHPLFNLGQALPDGKNWNSSSLSGKAGELEVAIAWTEGIRGPKPTISLVLRPSNAGKAAAGIARLEALFWDHLFGPEPFELRKNVALALPKFGRPFAVAAVTKTPCQAE